jgi:nicotinamidase-related amidase
MRLLPERCVEDSGLWPAGRVSLPRLTHLIRHATLSVMEPSRGSNASERAAESDRALVILDMTLDRFHGLAAVAGAAAIVRFVQGELRYFRERGRPVVFANSDGHVIQELTPRSDEVIFKKPGPSAFFGTALDDALRSQGIRRVTLVGLETHTAVLLTAADAMARGYEVVVPEPCVCAHDAEAHAAALSLLRRYWPVVFTPAPSPESTALTL